MKRERTILEKQQFDVVVVGGGIHGATAAWQCAAQGMKVALLEKGDFGSVTSANSLKIIHGGFRYLQHLNIKRMRESIRSRRIMSQVSPENVKALRCLIPTSRGGLQNKYLMRLALLLNDLIAWDRNSNVAENCRIPAGSILSQANCRGLFPLVDWSGKTGGAIWYDALALNSERLTLAFVHRAASMGACVANYMEVKELSIADGRVSGCRVFDSLDQTTFPVAAKTMVISAGPCSDRLLGMYQHKKKVQKKWAKAVNIVVDQKLLSDTAIGLTGEKHFVDNDAVFKKKGRFFFFVPWRGFTMIGTTYTFQVEPSTELRVTDEDVAEILKEVNDIMPQAGLTPADVTKTHCGLVPAYSSDENSEVQLVKETAIDDLGKKVVNPVDGLFTVKSVKYTTAPIVAIELAAIVAKFLHRPFSRKNALNAAETSRGVTMTTTGGGAFPDAAAIVERYGYCSDMVMSYLHRESALLSTAPLLYSGEIDYFVKEEMASSLGDVVFRRSEIATAKCPDRDLLIRIAQRIGAHLHWDPERIEEEVKVVEESFLSNMPATH